MPPPLLHCRCPLLSAVFSRCLRPCQPANTTTPLCRRTRHSSSTARHDVQVACRSNGSVHLSILRSHQHHLHSPILLFLPPGPLLPETPPKHHDDILNALCAASNATVVCVNYKIGEDHRFPTPIHDVLTAYDWVLQNIAAQPQHSGSHKPHMARIGVCGELIGGSLATMLALTECHMGTHRIAAAAVNNPVLDWVFPTDLHPDDESEDDIDISSLLDDQGRITRWSRLETDPVARMPSWDEYGGNPALPVSAITHARNSLFANDNAYFDRFASPIHFFRTPGISYVLPMLTDDDLASQIPAEPEMSENDLDFEPSSQSSMGDAIQPIVQKRRRSHRIYPPTGFGLRLPFMNVRVGEESALRDQGEEFVKLYKRSLLKDSQSEEEAERRVRLTLRPGVGLWSDPSRASDWREDVRAVGAWFSRLLG